MQYTIPLNIAKSDPVTKQKLGSFRSQKICLIACPWVFHEDAEFQSQQLGLAYVGSYIIHCGHQVVGYLDPMLDGGHLVKEPIVTEHQTINRVGHSDEWILDNIPPEADWIFINVPFTDSRFVFYPLCNKIKDRYPSKTIVVGGILATTLPIQILDHTKADVIVKGEGEICAARILNGESWEKIPGTVFRKNGEIFEHPKRSEQLLNIDDIPRITNYNFRPMDKYANWSPRGNKSDRTFSYISSRGCPFTCEFCSIPEKGQQWRSFSPKRVIEEIEFMIENHGITHLEIEDDNFTLKAKHSLPILKHLKELRDKGHKIVSSFPNGIMIDRLDREHIFALADAGTECVYLPIESGDLKNLIAMNKPVALEHLDQSLRVAEWCYEAKLEVGAFFIVGYPGGRVASRSLKKVIYDKYKDSILEDDGTGLWIKGEDEESFQTTLKFAKKLKDAGVTFITPLIATPYPGTALYDICERFGWLRHEDKADMVTTISYQNPKEEFVNISTPWCSYVEAFKRWKTMEEMFPIKHNVMKEK